MPPSDLALFRTFPMLRGRLPHHPVATLPTPVEPLALDGIPPDRLYVKRDDRCCPFYGGNKPRKLEFILGHARALGARRLVTTGGLGTNHGLATTILGREAGLETTCVLVDQPLTDAVEQTLLLHAAFGARLVYGRNVPGTALQVLRVLGASALRGERPYLVSTGGSSARGNLGFVSAGLEIAEQVRSGALPEPAELFVAVGTGGTLAGLVAGLKLAGLSTRVVGVLVTDLLPPSPAALVRKAHAALRRLRGRGGGPSDVAISTRDFELVGGQLGPGYGAPTPAGRDAVAAAAACGLGLDTTYTGKCLAEIRERAVRGKLPDGPVLFWNTYNGIDVAAHAPHPLDCAALPRPFQRILATRPSTDQSTRPAK